VPPTTEITLVGGKAYQVEGEGRDVERAILDAARGSLMQFAWFVELATGERLGVNPAQVVGLRSLDA
jgi:hypothetical protein